MTKPKEQCAYAKLGMQKDACEEIRCDGYSESCFQYTTINHLAKFRGMFRFARTPEHPRVEGFRKKWGRTPYKCLEGSVK